MFSDLQALCKTYMSLSIGSDTSVTCVGRCRPSNPFYQPYAQGSYGLMHSHVLYNTKVGMLRHSSYGWDD